MSSISSNVPSGNIVTPAKTGQKLSNVEMIDRSVKNLAAVQNQFDANVSKYSQAGSFEWVPFIGGKQKREENLAQARSAKENADFFIRKLYDLLQEAFNV